MRGDHSNVAKYHGYLDVLAYEIYCEASEASEALSRDFVLQLSFTVCFKLFNVINVNWSLAKLENTFTNEVNE